MTSKMDSDNRETNTRRPKADAFQMSTHSVADNQVAAKKNNNQQISATEQISAIVQHFSSSSDKSKQLQPLDKERFSHAQFLILDNTLRSTWYLGSSSNTSFSGDWNRDHGATNPSTPDPVRFALSTALTLSARCKFRMMRRVYKRGMRVLVLDSGEISRKIAMNPNLGAGYKSNNRVTPYPTDLSDN